MRPIRRLPFILSGHFWNSRKILVALFFLASLAPLAHSQDFNDYKFQIQGDWWYPENSGQIYGSGHRGYFDLSKDFGFSYYSTFSANFDWQFKRKHHLLFNVSPIDNTASRVITRTINFEDKTFTIGTKTTAEIKTLSFSPGYQYDIFRRDHGYFALRTQFYLLNSTASLSGTAVVNGQSVSQYASDSTLSAVPVLGARARWYPLHDSNRISLDGWAQGMYFFGYGDFWSARGVGNVGILPHLSLTGGYLLGSALSVHEANNRIGLRLKQKGAIVGFEATW